jgi:formate--tetrahydrofolate ligase
MTLTAIVDVAAELGLGSNEILPWGEAAAKVRPEAAFAEGPLTGALVLVSAMSPTPSGEGKTTTAIGLTQAARKRGHRAVVALRQPSLGPVFGQKGGGAGGGRAEVVPSTRINLHLTGDIHAVTAAHNLLAAIVDQELHFRGESGLDPRKVSFRRVLDVNDRALRRVMVGLGGATHGVPREAAFDITAASEVMAILCLSKDWADLKHRLGEIVVGETAQGEPVRARDLHAQGAMAVILRDALLPNIVQTTEGAPALVHGGPFANIAHGTSSLVAARLAQRKADLVFTEAGFAFDLGGEKFFDIVCRAGGFFPRAVVLVATLQALRYHGAAQKDGSDAKEALLRGMANLDKHVESVRAFGLDPVISVNVHSADTEDELRLVEKALRERGYVYGRSDVYAKGGDGALELVDLVVAKTKEAAKPATYLYGLDDSFENKVRAIATKVYGASEVRFSPAATAELARATRLGYANFPVCMAKTHLSLSDDEKRVGRPEGFTVTVREVRISAGAGFVVCLTGEVMTMPGLPKKPRTLAIDLLPDGTIVGVT